MGNVLEGRQHGILYGILSVFGIPQPAHGHSPEVREAVRQNTFEF
jgi:hypothetical protein